jgi:hypothetical protein
MKWSKIAAASRPAKALASAAHARADAKSGISPPLATAVANNIFV